MNIFLVGGSVRDKLLGIKSCDHDWVVVGGDTQTLINQGFVSVGQDFPVFLPPKTKEEYALARKERKTGPGYTGFEFDTGETVTLEEDLSRRDLTINAIAENEHGEIVDPFNGQHDLKIKKLRHVSAAFTEDPVRILRVARFAARYHYLGFSIASETMQLMQSMVINGEVDHLVSERVWKEFEKALGEQNPEVFISVLRECGALKIIMPELNALFGVPQPKAHHPEIDTGIHSLMVLQQATKLSTNTVIRFASLMHDLGKALTPKEKLPSHHGHEDLGLTPLAALCERLKAPKEYSALAGLVTQFHTHCHRAFELRANTLLTLLKKTDAFRRPERFHDFLVCCKADAQGRTGFENRLYQQANFLAYAHASARAVTTEIFIKQGLKGKEIGDALDQARLNEIKNLKRAYSDTTKIEFLEQ